MDMHQKWSALAMPKTGMVVLYCMTRCTQLQAQQLSWCEMSGISLPRKFRSYAWHISEKCTAVLSFPTTRPVHVEPHIGTMVRHCPYGICRRLSNAGCMKVVFTDTCKFSTTYLQHVRFADLALSEEDCTCYAKNWHDAFVCHTRYA